MPTKRNRPLAHALQRAMEARGLAVNDLARLTGLPPATVRGIVTGESKKPQQRIRDALDRELAAGFPGTTLRIIEGRGVDYPDNETNELIRLVLALPARHRRLVADLLRALSDD